VFQSILPIDKPRDRNKTNGPDPPESILQSKLQPKCHISIKEAISAIGRAKTINCKQEIADVTCLSLDGKLFPTKLPNYCPIKGILFIRVIQ